jgi:hypothetical protein
VAFEERDRRPPPPKDEKKRSEPKRFLENIRTSSVEKLEQTTRCDENVTYIKPRKVPNEGADEVGTQKILSSSY